jgi:hypothetical protein
VLVEPRHQLQATGNVLHIEARPDTNSDDIDDFILDNMVIMYKVAGRRRPPIGSEPERI